MKNLWRLRLLYFFFYASIGVFFPFINVYYRELGLTGTQIGLINTLAPLVGILSMTLWGMLNDRFGRTGWLLAAAALGAMCGALGQSAMRSLGGLALMACAQTLFTSSIPPLLDSTTLSVLGQQREHYGRQRV
jgi:PPP family 3-phenylpropionic acid transporter